MRQSIPAVPIIPGISRTFADILISGVGHLKNFHCPGIGHLPTHRAALGHPCQVLVTHVIKGSLKLFKMITFVKIFFVSGHLLNKDHAFSVLQ